MTELTGEVVRVSFDVAQDRELLILLRTGPGSRTRLFSLMLGDDLRRDRLTNRLLRLTQPGDKVQLKISMSPNGVGSLVRFENLTLEGLLRFAE